MVHKMNILGKDLKRYNHTRDGPRVRRERIHHKRPKQGEHRLLNWL